MTNFYKADAGEHCIYVNADRDNVRMTVGTYVKVCMSIKEARRLATLLTAQAAYAELHGLEEDQHPDAIAARNYMANAKRMREAGR